MRIFTILGPVLLLATVAAGQVDTPRLQLEFEGGPVWQTVNDVQIPNDASGTRFSLVDAIGKGSWPVFRFYTTWNINDRHGLRVLWAPLSVTEAGLLSGPVAFAGGNFTPGTPAEATYKFNSWRLSYRYRFHQGDDRTWWIGFTGKIRDAKVALLQPGVAAEKTDVGFVPLLHLALDWRLSDKWSMDVDLDALAGGPGRAEDASLKFRYRISDRMSLAGGYRTVEGGADVDEVYSFAWLHYAVGSVRLSF